MNKKWNFFQLAFLQCDRFLEFHAQHGKYYRTRIPKYGRDLDFHQSSCDLYIVGARWAEIRAWIWFQYFDD